MDIIQLSYTLITEPPRRSIFKFFEQLDTFSPLWCEVWDHPGYVVRFSPGQDYKAVLTPISQDLTKYWVVVRPRRVCGQLLTKIFLGLETAKYWSNSPPPQIDCLEIIWGDEVENTSDIIWYNYNWFLKYVFEWTKLYECVAYQAIATPSIMLTESTPTEISTLSSTPSTGMMMSSTWTELTSSTT